MSFLMFVSVTVFAQTGIGTTNPDPSAMLDVSSNDKGLLPPRMTELERDAISSPTDGLVIYQTDGTVGLYVRSSSAWVKLAGSNSSESGGGHYVGELFDGGIVFYVYNNGSNGLIVSLDDLYSGSGVAWSGNTSTLIGPTAQSYYDGAANTTAIVIQDATASKAGTLCDSYTGGSQTDWYLPSIWELKRLYNSAFCINTILENDSDGTTNGLKAADVPPTRGRYWSSTESNSSSAWSSYFSDDFTQSNSKSTVCRVRAIRAF
jgi:hypothetical protein